ncbi:hypothetical protein PpBr36_07490, partial [Pyricularia pennisetigena]|uniref:hypothetical protein n=1 Tax=Pyricularia pennisetigena TaxID=1578925 RepID=UPI00114FD487
SRSNRQNRRDTEPRAPRNQRIAGPTSALTDYLAANNISAAEIARNHSRRQQAALTEAVAAEAAANRPLSTNRNGSSQPASTPGPSNRSGNLPGALTNASSVAALADGVNPTIYKKKLTKAEAKAIEHYKTTDDFANAKQYYQGNVEDEDQLARMFYFTAKKAVGQFENCANCGKRFTVTAYTSADPDGGLLCTACGKELAKEAPKKRKQVASGGPIGKRRAAQSRVLDGTASIGVKSLVEICIQHLSKNIELADDLGVLPEHVVDRISRILAKRRMLKSEVLPLFLQPGTRALRIYDSAKLSSQDMISIFQVIPDLKILRLRNAIQFKDEVMSYLLDRPTKLEVLSLHGCNLITTELWERFFVEKGESLHTLQIYRCGDYFTDAVVAKAVEHCPNLRRLKLQENLNVSYSSLESLQTLGKLEHLSLKLWNKDIPNPVLVSLIDALGPKLQTLSLKLVEDANDTVLQAIHRNCKNLSKLRITGSKAFTDDALMRLFTDWANPPLRFVSFENCRSMTHGENLEEVGLCDKGFGALMAHSGRKIQHINIESCRHISAAAFLAAFDQDKTYPDLETIEISFCENVTDFIVGSIFRSCPALKWVKVFGCMKVKDVLVPRGRILIGVPTAAGMQIEGYA